MMCLFQVASAQPIPIENIERAMKQGNASDLSDYFGASVDITINKNQSTYSATQAQLVMSAYFKKNPVKDFSFSRISPPSAMNTLYAIGTLATKNGVFKVYVYLKGLNTQPYLQQLKIEK